MRSVLVSAQRLQGMVNDGYAGFVTSGHVCRVAARSLQGQRASGVAQLTRCAEQTGNPLTLQPYLVAIESAGKHVDGCTLVRGCFLTDDDPAL
jgi:hypothetical protein